MIMLLESTALTMLGAVLGGACNTILSYTIGGGEVLVLLYVVVQLIFVRNALDRRFHRGED